MQIKFLFLSLCSGFASSGILVAEATKISNPVENIVVTATRNPIPSRELGSTLIIIQRGEIEDSGAKTLGELLLGQPGISVRRSGGAGSNTEILIRGDKGGHTLVMVDGMEWADPSSIEKNFDIGDLPLHDVERIEIVKGPHSVSYGASGLSGIIHIITRRPRDGVTHAVGVELGSYQTFGIHARTDAQQGLLGISAAVSGLNSAGFSSTQSRDQGEADAYDRRDASLRLQWGSRQPFSADLLIKAARSNAGIDAGSNSDDPNFTAKREDISFQLMQKMRWNDQLETHLATVLSKSERRFQDDPDALVEGHDQTWQRIAYHGERRSLDFSQLFHFTENQTAIASAQWLRDSAHAKTDANYQGYVVADEFPEQHMDESSYALQHQWGFMDSFFGQWGVRSLTNSEFGKKTIAQAAFNVQVLPKQTVLRLNLGRGFKTPSLYQRLAPIYGNSSLQPEFVRSAEFGLEQTWNAVQLNLTEFYNRTENLIEFDGNDSRYYNVNRARIKGLEATLVWEIDEVWGLKAQHTQLSSLDEESNQPLASRPDESWSGNLSWKHRGFTQMTAVRGQTRSRAGQYVQGSKGFQVLDSTLSWKIAAYKHQVKVSNIENRNYQEVANYNTPGRNFLLSSEVEF